MKIKQEHYNYMRDTMRDYKYRDRIAEHRTALLNDPRVKDIEKRIRWDWLYASGLTAWICKELYEYMNDEHIDTALRSIVKELES